MKRWHKPELIVLVRGTADERVLQGCKGEGPYLSGPRTEQIACYVNGDYCGPCHGEGNAIPNPDFNPTG